MNQFNGLFELPQEGIRPRPQMIHYRDRTWAMRQPEAEVENNAFKHRYERCWSLGHDM